MATKKTTVAKVTKATTETAPKAPAKTSVDTAKVETKKAEPKKEATKKAPAKAPAKKTEKVVAPALFLQANGKELSYDDIIAMVKAAWKDQFNGKVKDFVNVQIYIKPEEGKAYFVVNGNVKPEYFVEL